MKITAKTHLVFWIFFIIIALGLGYFFSTTPRDKRLRNPTTALDYYFLGKYYDQKNDYEKAEAALEKAISLDGGVGKIYLMLGVINIERGDYSPAERNLLRAKELIEGKDRDNEEIVHWNLGGLYEKVNEPKKAWDHFKIALENKRILDDESWKDVPDANTYYVIHDDYEEFEKRVMRMSLPSGITKRTDRYYKWNNLFKYNDILRDCRDYIETNPDSPFIYSFLEWIAYVKSSQHQYGEALSVLDKIEHLGIPDKKLVFVTEQRAFIYKEIKRFEESLDLYEKLLTKYKDHIGVKETLYYKSLVYKDMLSPLEEKTLENIIQWYPATRYSQYASVRLGDIHLFRGEYAQSYRYYSQGKHGKQLLLIFLGSIVGAGVLWFIFYLTHIIFFSVKRESLEASAYRKHHLFVFLAVALGAPLLIFDGLMAFNAHVCNVLEKVHLNPQLLAIIIGDLILGWMVIYLFKYRYNLTFHTIGLTVRKSWHVFFLPILLTAIMLGVNYGYEHLLMTIGVRNIPESRVQDIIHNVHANPGVMQYILLYINMILIGPIVEELVFRVFTIEFLRKYTNLAIAVIASCVLFTIGHGPLLILPFYFIFALIFAITYISTGSIIPCMVTHIAYNLIVTLSNFVSQ